MPRYQLIDLVSNQIFFPRKKPPGSLSTDPAIDPSERYNCTEHGMTQKQAVELNKRLNIAKD